MAAQSPPALRGRSSESELLDRLLEGARGGRSGVLVIRGEAGVGKTALICHAAGRASGFRVAEVCGIEAERELPFAALHQLLGSCLDGIGALPEPQRDALRVALGSSAGPAPDRFLVGLAALTLMAEVAEEQPLLCIVDDLQWVDEATGQVLGFVARRVLAESVAIVFGLREPSDRREVAGLPELRLEGLAPDEARALLADVVPGRLDDRVAERIIAETSGNPLALLELPRGMDAAELAAGFGAPGPRPEAIDDCFRSRLDRLPADTRLLVRLAAADPVGDALLVWRAAERLGLDPDAAAPAVEAGLLQIGARVRFRHPSVRSAAYHSASPTERRALHAALAEATDGRLDPDRRAWHRAQATPSPDEQVAEELERSAGRALARGGLAAAAAFLDRAAMLTPQPAHRASRLLAAARAKSNAGAFAAALELVSAAQAAAIDALQAAEVEELRGDIAFEERRVGEAARLLAGAAKRFEAIDADRARAAHLKALVAAVWAGSDDLLETARASRRAPPASEPPSAADILLDALATRLTEGYAAAVPALRRAAEAMLALDIADNTGRRFWLTGTRAGSIAVVELWDLDVWHAVATRLVDVARELGALVRLQSSLQFLARSRLHAGELAAAALAIDEDRAIAAATGTSPVHYVEMALAAWRGQEALTAELIERQRREASERGIGRVDALADYATAVLNNAIGRYDVACDAARRTFESDPLGYTSFVVPELAEAASRIGQPELLDAAVGWMSERTAVTPTGWALGMDARVRALASEGDAAEALYRESIDHLSHTCVRAELARTRLLYGEWLRRESRRVNAREQLRAAREALLSIGADGFAERARHELLATGEKVRKRRADTRDELTPQEEHIARLAREGRTNPEIGAELFLSPRTVEWHLKKVFAKLGITSRRELRDALPREPAVV
jgi:DNA-binding CsgD family transcriptional regulator